MTADASPGAGAGAGADAAGPAALGPVLFDHVGQESLDIEADVALYTDRLGLALIRWGEHAVTGLRIAMLHADHGVKVELIEVRERTGAWDHAAFRVADVAPAAALAASAGLAVPMPPLRITAARADVCTLTAPGGAAVQFLAYDADSPDLVG